MPPWDAVLRDPAVGMVVALAGTLLWVVRRIVTGALVPRSTYEDMRDARDAERARWDALADRLEGVEEGLRLMVPLWQAASQRGALVEQGAVPRRPPEPGDGDGA